MHQLQQGQFWLQLSFPFVCFKLASNNSRNLGHGVSPSQAPTLIFPFSVPLTMCPRSLCIHSFSGHSSEPHAAVTSSTGSEGAWPHLKPCSHKDMREDKQNLALICMFCPCNKLWGVSLNGDCFLIASLKSLHRGLLGMTQGCIPKSSFSHEVYPGCLVGLHPYAIFILFYFLSSSLFTTWRNRNKAGPCPKEWAQKWHWHPWREEQGPCSCAIPQWDPIHFSLLLVHFKPHLCLIYPS